MAIKCPICALSGALFQCWSYYTYWPFLLQGEMASILLQTFSVTVASSRWICTKDRSGCEASAVTSSSASFDKWSSRASTWKKWSRSSSTKCRNSCSFCGNEWIVDRWSRYIWNIRKRTGHFYQDASRGDLIAGIQGRGIAEANFCLCAFFIFAVVF